jgi:hypothetical protein
MIERGGGVEACEPDQHIAKPAVEIGQHKAQLPGLRDQGLNVSKDE